MRARVELVVSLAPFIVRRGEQVKTPRFVRELELDAIPPVGAYIDAAGVSWMVARVTLDLDEGIWWVRTEPLVQSRGDVLDGFTALTRDGGEDWIDALVAAGWERS